MEEINLTTGQKLTSHYVSRVSGGMGDGGAASMQVEIGEDNVHDPTCEFISRGAKNFLADFDQVKI